MDSKQQIEIISLKNEIDRLQKKVFLLEKQNRELEKDVNDYILRERHLMDEITELSNELATFNEKKIQIPAQSKEDFLNPKSPFSKEKIETGSGLEADWSEFMYAYTSEIFIENNYPDLPLYKDYETGQYLSPNNATVLIPPITQKDLDKNNILKIRPMTNVEINDLLSTHHIL